MASRDSGIGFFGIIYSRAVFFVFFITFLPQIMDKIIILTILI